MPRVPSYLTLDLVVSTGPAIKAFIPALDHDVEPLAAMHALYLDSELRVKYGIGLDHSRELYLDAGSLTGADLVAAGLEFWTSFRAQRDWRIREVKQPAGQFPAILGGGDRNYNLVNQLGNYIPFRWTKENGCVACAEHERCLYDVPAGQFNSSASVLPLATGVAERKVWPILYVAVTIHPVSPFLTRFLERIALQRYPKDRIDLTVLVVPSPSATNRTYPLVKRWASRDLDDPAGGGGYRRLSILDGSEPGNGETEVLGRWAAAAKDSDAVGLVRLNSRAMLNNTGTFTGMIEANREVIGPLLRKPGLLFSNFWASIGSDRYAMCRNEDRRCDAWRADGYCSNSSNYFDWMGIHCPLTCGVCNPPADDLALGIDYARGFDYNQLAIPDEPGGQRGVWAVPMLTTCAFYSQRALEVIIEEVFALPRADLTELDNAAQADPWVLDAILVDWIKAEGMLIHMSNQRDWGWYAGSDGFDHSRLHPELAMLKGNTGDWEEAYLDPRNKDMAVPNLRSIRPECWDIYNFPIFSHRFTDELVAEAEHYGQWSGSQYEDDRLAGGYENVPTQDIHFNQFGFDETWIEILKRYIAPVAEAQYTGYTFTGKKTLDFIVRYKPEGQPSLRPHFDSSTFSLNVALNQIGIDFEGGGTHFTRQNCTVLENAKGSGIIHPGTLTHQHEGLPVTNGTRYIIVSFVDQR